MIGFGDHKAKIKERYKARMAARKEKSTAKTGDTAKKDPRKEAGARHAYKKGGMSGFADYAKKYSEQMTARDAKKSAAKKKKSTMYSKEGGTRQTARKEAATSRMTKQKAAVAAKAKKIAERRAARQSRRHG